MTSRICWDTMLFIYWLEKRSKYVARLARSLERMETRGDWLCSSAFGVGEQSGRMEDHLAC